VFVHKNLISDVLVSESDILNNVLTEEFNKDNSDNQGSLQLDFSKMQVFPIPLLDNNTIALTFTGKYTPNKGSD
jgi:hypothetical protein